MLVHVHICNFLKFYVKKKTHDLEEWLGKWFEEIQELARQNIIFQSEIFSALATRNRADTTYE